MVILDNQLLKFMKRISEILSALFTPLLVPTYGMIFASFLSVLAVLPLTVLLTTIGITFILTCILPLIGIMVLYRTGYVKSPTLRERTERFVPFGIAFMCYLGCAFFLYRASAPLWLTMFYIGGAAAIVISAVVCIWWKISAHAAAVGGLVAMTFRLAASHQAIYDMNVWISALVVIAGMVMTARVYLGRHTLMQVLAGCANGFLCVWLMTMIR